MHQNADKLSSRVRKRIKKICTLQVALTSDDCVSYGIFAYSDKALTLKRFINKKPHDC